MEQATVSHPNADLPVVAGDGDSDGNAGAQRWRRVSVVLPIYRTGHCFPELYQRLRQTLTQVAREYEIIAVDDGSPDDAWSVVRPLAEGDPSLKAIRFSRNFGQHPAIAAGFEQASGDAIVLMDADLQDRPEDIPLLLSKLTGDVDAVYTVKQGGAEPLHVRITSRLYHYVFSRLTRTNVPRDIGTFRAFSRRMLDAILDYPERGVLYGPLMFHAGFNMVTVPVAHQERGGTGGGGGRSSYTFRKRLALAINSILSYTDLPHRMLVLFGSVILTCSVLYAIAIVLKYLITGGGAPPGITLIVLLSTITLGTTMFGLGILGVYVFRVYQEVLGRPRYIVSRSVNVERPVNGAVRVGSARGVGTAQRP